MSRILTVFAATNANWVGRRVGDYFGLLKFCPLCSTAGSRTTLAVNDADFPPACQTPALGRNMGSWGCLHESNGVRQRVNSSPLRPGDEGMRARRAFRFQ